MPEIYFGDTYMYFLGLRLLFNFWTKFNCTLQEKWLSYQLLGVMEWLFEACNFGECECLCGACWEHLWWTTLMKIAQCFSSIRWHPTVSHLSPSFCPFYTLSFLFCFHFTLPLKWKKCKLFPSDQKDESRDMLGFADCIRWEVNRATYYRF